MHDDLVPVVAELRRRAAGRPRRPRPAPEIEHDAHVVSSAGRYGITCGCGNFDYSIAISDVQTGSELADHFHQHVKEGTMTHHADDGSTALTEGGEPVEPLLEHFEFEHLPEAAMRDQSSHFSALAHSLVENLPPSSDRTYALRKLSEAKNTAVAAVRRENARRAAQGMHPLSIHPPRLT